jgi:hypothetical protein
LPPLRNARHEKLARELAKGKKNIAAAMRSAGYMHPTNSTRLMNNNEVQARLKELQEQYATRCALTKEALTQKFQLAFERAMETNQVSAAVQAVREIAVMHGLRVERQEVAPAGTFETMTDQDYVAKVVERIQQALAFATERPPSDTEQ